MKNSKFKVMLVALFMVGSSLAVFAQDGDPRPERHERGKKEWSKKGNHQRGGFIPNLTEEQKTKMKDLRMAFQKETMPMKNDLNEKRAKLRTLTTVDSPDMKKVNKLIEDMGEVEVKLHKAKVAHQQEVRKQLTEEQRIAFDSHSGKRGRHHGRK
ncbi:Spy/CpxP family protein refolding chaperone [Fulvivirga ligni]|uniref:Spy/CpxP family protein refolding chaperone n=1 Tax=Fulvivirga ligni TaxID=2904246 RepID=UPI001F35FDAC|nr:Spy/CpxP family protein refolding chaperone [Fulvivirga ligni]UII23104.1 Spy/CpxP family protein refolding chaperone [Fulvivirga ligni]